MTETQGLCEFCRELKPVVWTDSVDRGYCADCLGQLLETTPSLLDYLATTIPFQVGDRVECRTAGVLYDGIGVIDEVSTDLAKFGTPVYPSFHVVIDQPAYPEAPSDVWYMERQLRRVDA